MNVYWGGSMDYQLNEEKTLNKDDECFGVGSLSATNLQNPSLEMDLILLQEQYSTVSSY